MGDFKDRLPAVGKEGWRKITVVDPETSGLTNGATFKGQVEFADDATEQGTLFAKSAIATPAEGIDPTNDDKVMSVKSLTTTLSNITTLQSNVGTLQEDVKINSIYNASSTGSDAYAITTDVTALTYAAGLIISFKADVSNAGASTVNVDSLGIKNFKIIGPGGKVDTKTGDIIAGGIYHAIYDATDFIITNPNSVLQSVVTAQGDLLYASGANTVANLAKGTAGQSLLMNSAANAPEWATTSAKGTTTSFPGSITAGNTSTTTIALGFAANFGKLMIHGDSDEGASVIFSTDENDAIGMSDWGTDSATNSYADDTKVVHQSVFGVSNAAILRKVWIDGTDLKLEYYNSSGSSQTVSGTRITWEVWS